MIYRFEGLDETLDLVPLAGRRALDRAGCKVSLAAWRAASLATRQVIVTLGADVEVDTARVRQALDAGGVALVAIPPVDDPLADAVPGELSAPLGPAVGDETWRTLSALDRYALAKLARKENGAEKLAGALTEIVVVHEPRLSHLSARGEAHMVDVSAKAETLRRAVARATVRMKEATTERLRSGTAPKGDVLAAARLAGIQAAKRTPELIPLCHTVRLTRVTVELRIEPGQVRIEAAAEAVDRTGVEMEALVAASTAALTVYDMLKGIDRGMTIELGLEHKTGGASGPWERGRTG
jgi:molybdenum cofactor biosynthesis protein MoaC